PSSVATSRTGEGAMRRPRPAGRSGCVTTPTMSKPSSESARSEGTANSGVPQKRILTGASSPAGARLLLLLLGAQLLPLLEEHPPLEGAHPVEEEDPLDVVDLVLQRAREELVRLDRDRVPLGIEALHAHRGGALHDLLETGDAQAALRLALGLLARPRDPRVDDRHPLVGPLLAAQVHHDDPLRQPDLGRRQADPLRVVRRL